MNRRNTLSTWPCSRLPPAHLFFDDIGNRTWTKTNSVQSDYTANALNQYTDRTNPAETFTHDDDGNLTVDGKWNYTWDAENRLKSMDTKTGVTPVLHLVFEYDHQGRRIRKTVRDGNQLLTDEKFCYDGWNLLAVLNVTNSARIKSFLWGLDLSGSQQGAGGVGGLLAVWTVSDGNHFVCYDGNGNVMKLVSTNGTTITANYEYSPFGDVVLATGSAAAVNPFRFSTKYQDDETGLLYYGYRYYIPGTGRWTSRDPIEEKRGGPNLYVFAANSSPTYVDSDGRELVAYCPICLMPISPFDKKPHVCRRPPPPLPPHRPLGDGPKVDIENPRWVTTEFQGLRISYCCSGGKLVGLTVPLDTNSRQDIQGPGDTTISVPQDTWLSVCCNPSFVQLSVSKKVTIWPDGIVGFLLHVTVSYMVFDNEGKVVASDTSMSLVPQVTVDAYIEENVVLKPSIIDTLRASFSKLDFLCK